MAKRHNEYSRLLKTVENNPQPLIKQVVKEQGLPMTDVPDLGSIADSCQMMGEQLMNHSKHLQAMSDMQPSWDEEVGEQGMGGMGMM